MPENNLIKLGQRLRAARKEAGLTQEQLADRSHVSTKHIANIEKGKMNPSFEILLALSKVLKLSLDSLISVDMNEDEEACKQLAASYLSCPPSVRGTLLSSMRSFANELTELAERLDAK